MRQDDDRTYSCLDMALVDDEALIVLAHECEYSPARDEILLRYRPQTERLIQWLGPLYRVRFHRRRRCTAKCDVLDR